jgi:hypothetical protein
MYIERFSENLFLTITILFITSKFGGASKNKISIIDFASD